jgi:hypothetical protein
MGPQNVTWSIIAIPKPWEYLSHAALLSSSSSSSFLQKGHEPHGGSRQKMNNYGFKTE